MRKRIKNSGAILLVFIILRFDGIVKATALSVRNLIRGVLAPLILSLSLQHPSTPILLMKFAAMKNKRLSGKKQKTDPETFDPFNSRLSRDIRNSLSDAFKVSLKQRDAGCYLNRSQKWLKKDLAPACRNYVQDRIRRYDMAFQRIQGEQIDNARIQAVILWNYRLFFEVHDIVEDIWHKTQGDEHQAVKGFIKAAGVYVHLESGRVNSAQRLAIKSVRLLQEFEDGLGFISNLNVLIGALKICDPIPPVLKSSYEQERNKNGKQADQ